MTWPRPSDIERFYGRHELAINGRPTADWERSHLTYIQTPIPLRLAWEKSSIVWRIRCHRKVADSLSRIFVRLAELAPEGSPERETLRLFGGCYQYRPIRGGSSLSLHSWGAAIDFDPDRNRLGTPGSMPGLIIDAFKAEGWAWGGDFAGRKDPMHFEAVQRIPGPGAGPPSGGRGTALIVSADATPHPAREPIAAPSPTNPGATLPADSTAAGLHHSGADTGASLPTWSVSITPTRARFPVRAVRFLWGLLPGPVRRWVGDRVAKVVARRVGRVLARAVEEEGKMSTPNNPKPGYKTTEFWMALLAQLMGFAYASGLIETGGTLDKIAGVIVMVLSAAGYAVSRGITKRG